MQLPQGPQEMRLVPETFPAWAVVPVHHNCVEAQEQYRGTVCTCRISFSIAQIGPRLLKCGLFPLSVRVSINPEGRVGRSKVQ